MVTMNDPPLQEMDADRAFLFLVHRKYGLLLLYITRKKSKGPHYQVPGGHVEQEDFDRAGELEHRLLFLDCIIQSFNQQSVYNVQPVKIRRTLGHMIASSLTKSALHVNYTKRQVLIYEIH